MHDTLKDCLPSDHARQVGSTYYIDLLLRDGPKGRRVLDVGCGIGRSADEFQRRDPSIQWHGLDIEQSPEVNARTRTDLAFHTFDGVNIPFGAHEFDIVYSHQVFEHVRHPEPLLAEVARVLKPGGAFIGSVSALEPYHSYSYWSFTPFGWHVLLAGAGLEPVEFRPGIDGIALIRRQFEGRKPEHGAWFTSSPLNEEIDAWAKASGRGAAATNLRKLQFCGHLVFYARRRPDAAPSAKAVAVGLGARLGRLWTRRGRKPG